MVHLATSSITPWDLAVVDDSIIWTDLTLDAIGVTSTNSSSGYSFYHHNTFQDSRGIYVYREEIPTTTEVYNPTTDQSDPESDLTCDSVSMTLIINRTLLEIGDNARDVHFVDESCVGYDHDSQHVAITTMYDRCGTTQEQDDNYIIFTNMVTYYKPRPENGTNELITREHYLHIPVTCYLERTQVLEESFLPEENLYVSEKKGYGDFSLNLDRYTNSGFYQPTNDSGEVTLGTPLYFGVRLTSVTNLTLLIESCWATSSPDPGDDHRYNIIEKGCAVDSTTVIYNLASPTFKGFSIDAFTFIGDNDEVYVHCSILICDNNDSGSRCAQGCIARSRRSLKNTGFPSKLHTITNGPLSDASRSQRAMLLDSVYDL
eukprot:XP_011661679.1 PREDICTED: oncoprotein-induced transcript 3 protein-like [Strongylocentrotus purpuratus]